MTEERIVPFRSSDELRKAMAEVPDPVYMAGALGPERRFLRSGCIEQVALNGAICDYIKALTERAKALSEEDLGLAVDIYREGKEALGILNTQRTKYLPREVREAKEAFEDLLVEALAPLAPRFPQETQRVFWKALAFRKGQSLSTGVETPLGPVTVGVSREERDPRWYPFIEWDQTGNRRKEAAATYIAAGTITARGGSITAAPLYDGTSFWGLEVTWTTRRGKTFAWEICWTGARPRFSLVREDPLTRSPEEIRQGDILLSPCWDSYGEPTVPPHELVGSCRFDPAPIGWARRDSTSFRAQFPAGTTEVVVRHPDHRTVRVRLGGAGLNVRSVGGRTHYGRDGGD